MHQILEPVTLDGPFWRHLEMYAGEPYAFLLDSATEAAGQFSFIGAHPSAVLSARDNGDGQALIDLTRFDDEGTPQITSSVGDPFEALRSVLASRSAPAGAPAPFTSGGVGYFSYEAGGYIERVPRSGADDLQLPDMCWMFVDAVLAHDHTAGTSFICAVGRGPTAAAARAGAERAAGSVRSSLSAFECTQSGLPPESGPVDVDGHFVEASYAALVERARAHILAGDVFEVCLTHRLEAPMTASAWSLYGALRDLNPAPFASFLALPFAEVVSSSPERFLQLDDRRGVESCPIKGTRRRGRDAEQDAALAESLATSQKDRAENMMIVDLVRNDLGRVCELFSVRVPSLMRIETHPTVFQMVSTVQGKLETGRDRIDLVQACFPGGSMTGAPKIEAMKIIDALEPVSRGIYSGSIGYLSDSGTMDLSIVIRTLIVLGGRCYFHVGGAVVADSDGVAEYRESMDKAAASIAALEVVSCAR